MAQKNTADGGFDEIVAEQWKKHLGSMRPELARTKNVRGTYYKLWLQNVHLAENVFDAKACGVADGGNDGCPTVDSIPEYGDRSFEPNN